MTSSSRLRPPAAPGPTPYRGRFAPSPTGPLHAGSLVAALASWLDARAHGGAWLVRIEDLDPPREVRGAARSIVETLAHFGLAADEPVVYQSQRHALYEAAFARLQSRGRLYGCACSRAGIQSLAAAGSGAGPVYPGTCRAGTGGRPVRAWRFRVPPGRIAFDERSSGHIEQDLEKEVGDFVVRRADGLWAYQLAVVVDDAEQAISHVVRGADLLDNTARQIALMQALDLPVPLYLHVPLVVNARGEKLSKQSGATALDANDRIGELERAAAHLGLPRIGAATVAAFLRAATDAWSARW